MSQKRPRDSESDEESIEIEKEPAEFSKSAESSKFSSHIPDSASNSSIHLNKQCQKPQVNDKISKKMMNMLQKVDDALIMKTGTNQADDQIESLAKKIKKMKKNLDKQQNQLALILSLLQKEKE